MSKQSENDTFGFNVLFSLMGTALLGVAGFIALQVMHLPVIEQKLEDYISATDKRIEKLEVHLIN